MFMVCLLHFEDFRGECDLEVGYVFVAWGILLVYTKQQPCLLSLNFIF